jgi:hypothetical protein
VMHFLFCLLRINGLYMFRALLAHPQEVLYKRHLVYCVRVLSVGCNRVELAQSTDKTRTQYTVTVYPGSYPDHDSSKREISKSAGLRVYCER